MLIQDSIKIPVSFPDVRRKLLDDPHAFFDDSVRAGYHAGEMLLTRIQPSKNLPLIGKNVWIDVEKSYPRQDGLVIPLHWWATGTTPLFPRLEADIEIMPIGLTQTQIAIAGRYDPPFGGVGRSLDRLLFHRLAEASIRTFLVRTGETLGKSTDPYLLGLAQSPEH